MNYYERYIGDYQRDTGVLTLAQHGAYMMLLDTYFATENPLPADYAALYRICSAMDSYEKAAVRVVADKFFPIYNDGFRHNSKADEVIPKAQRRIATAAQNGKKGGRPPKPITQEIPAGLFDENPSGNPLGNPAANPTLTQVESSPTPTPIKNKNISSESDGSESGFAEFWEAWPKTDRKTAKAECAKRWKTRQLSDVAEQILADVRRRKESRQWLDGFEPAPLTYLNQRRWEDAASSEPDPFA